jgi:hypothetical protein
MTIIKTHNSDGISNIEKISKVGKKGARKCVID